MEDNLSSWTKSVQQFGHSLQDKLDQTSEKAINTVTNTLDQAQNSLENNWQNITEIKNTTSGVIETTIITYVNNFVRQHPIVLKILQAFTWGINHPIISAIILLFIIAFIWSIIKGIVRLIETASWSIFKVPLKLFQVLMIRMYRQLIKLNLGHLLKFKYTQDQQINHFNSTVLSAKTISSQDKQERLLEIYHRLELIHQEQQQLLQEAANLINS